MRQHRQDPVVEAADEPDHRPALGRRRQRLGPHGAARPFAHPAVGNQRAVRRIDLGARIRRRVGQAPQQRPCQVGQQHRIVRIGDTHRALPQRAGIDARLLAQRRHLGLQQPVLVLVQIQQCRHQQGQRHEIDQQNAQQQRRYPAGASGASWRLLVWHMD
jgi:hypothetical protein